MAFSPSTLVSVNTNAAAVILVLGIIMLHIRIHRKKDTGYFLFLIFLVLILIMGILSVIRGVLENMVFTDSVRFRMFMDTVEEILIGFMNMDWFVYVLYMCFGSRDYLVRAVKYYMIPGVVLIILEVVNGFTGFQSYYDESLQYTTTVWYVLLSIVAYGYIIASAIILLRYRKYTGRLYFYNLWLMYFPVLLGSLIEDLTGYDAFTLGMGIGCMILFMSAANTGNYEDPESGFFNLRYFNYLTERIHGGRYELGSIVVSRFDDESVLNDNSALIREILPDDSDTVRTGSGEITTLAAVSDGGAVHMLSDDMHSIGEQLGVGLSVETFLRRKDESAETLFSRFLSGREKR